MKNIGKKKWPVLLALLSCLALCACEKDSIQQETTSSAPALTVQTEEAKEESILKIKIGEQELVADFADNPSAEAFRQLLQQGPVTVDMTDYGGFEKVGSLGTSITTSDTQITTEPGDVILYQGNQITIYYGKNTWNFTRLAKIRDTSDLKEKLGEGRIQVTFFLEAEE